MITKWVIFRCYNCSLPLYAETGQKTKKCPGCNKVIKMKTVKKLKYVEDIEVAIEIVKQLKTPKDIREEILEKKLRPSRKKSTFQKVMEITKDLSEKSIIGFTESEFKNQLSDLGMNDGKIVELFNRLINEGYIYQKSIGHYKKVGD